MTKSILEQLQDPFDPKDLGLSCKDLFQNSGGHYSGLFFIHKTAYCVIKRLNEVLNINWFDDYFRDSKGCLLCKLSIFDGDKQITRVGAGTPGNIERFKSEYTDALKRAADKFGIGLYLKRLQPVNVKILKEETWENPETKKVEINPFIVNMKLWRVKFEEKNGIFKTLKITDHNGKERKWT